ncbi:MAG: hypothetical protein ACRCRZ_01125 [Metamycoplasmataceae bacterium]
MKKIKKITYSLLLLGLSVPIILSASNVENVNSHNLELEKNILNKKNAVGPSDQQVNQINSQITNLKSNPDKDANKTGTNSQYVKVIYGPNSNSNNLRKILPSQMTNENLPKYVDHVENSTGSWLKDKTWSISEIDNKRGRIKINFTGKIQWDLIRSWNYWIDFWLDGMGYDLDDDGTNDFGKKTDNGKISFNEENRNIWEKISVFELSLDESDPYFIGNFVNVSFENIPKVMKNISLKNQFNYNFISYQETGKIILEVSPKYAFEIIDNKTILVKNNSINEKWKVDITLDGIGIKKTTTVDWKILNDTDAINYFSKFTLEEIKKGENNEGIKFDPEKIIKYEINDEHPNSIYEIKTVNYDEVNDTFDFVLYATKSFENGKSIINREIGRIKMSVLLKERIEDVDGDGELDFLKQTKINTKIDYSKFNFNFLASAITIEQIKQWVIIDLENPWIINGNPTPVIIKIINADNINGTLDLEFSISNSFKIVESPNGTLKTTEGGILTKKITISNLATLDNVNSEINTQDLNTKILYEELFIDNKKNTLSSKINKNNYNNYIKIIKYNLPKEAEIYFNFSHSLEGGYLSINISSDKWFENGEKKNSIKELISIKLIGFAKVKTNDIESNIPKGYFVSDENSVSTSPIKDVSIIDDNETLNKKNTFSDQINEENIIKYINFEWKNLPDEARLKWDIEKNNGFVIVNLTANKFFQNGVLIDRDLVIINGFKIDGFKTVSNNNIGVDIVIGSVTGGMLGLIALIAIIVILRIKKNKNGVIYLDNDENINYLEHDVITYLDNDENINYQENYYHEEEEEEEK